MSTVATDLDNKVEAPLVEGLSATRIVVTASPTVLPNRNGERSSTSASTVIVTPPRKDASTERYRYEK
jgi:hypothetical protein